MTNETLRKFGYPQNLICEYDHWCVLLRPAQVTLGSLILGAKGNWTAFSELPHQAFSELGNVVGEIETTLKTFRAWNKINYLMLMMVDPHVHFHVIPRYEKVQVVGTTEFPDKGWPAAPDLGSSIIPSEEVQRSLLSAIKAIWPVRKG